MKKFELTSETKIVFGRTLYRIKALISFGNVKAGELGGWIEKESNLSQNGNAWVYGSARVCDNAEVLWISKIGSRLGTTTFFRSKLGIEVSCGCFLGTLEQFAEKVEQTNGDSKYGKQYKLAIELAKLSLAEEKDEGSSQNVKN